MSTRKEIVAFILETLGNPEIFSARAMFGEYALYAKGKVVALICDDQLFIKIMPESSELESRCEKAQPYPNAKLHYLIEESEIEKISTLPRILVNIATALPSKEK